MKNSEPAKPRRRRSGDEVRQLLLHSAWEIFSSKGFSATSTREIAERAQVHEFVLYKNFGTKALLFERAIVEPVARFIRDYADRTADAWVSPPPARVGEELTYEFVSGLYKLLRTNRGALMAMLSADVHGEPKGSPSDRKDSPISEAIDRMMAGLDKELGEAEYSGVDMYVAARAAFGITFSLAVFDEFLFPRGARHPSEKRIIKEIVAMIHSGVRLRINTIPLEKDD